MQYRISLNVNFFFVFFLYQRAQNYCKLEGRTQFELFEKYKGKLVPNWYEKIREPMTSTNDKNHLLMKISYKLGPLFWFATDLNSHTVEVEFDSVSIHSRIFLDIWNILVPLNIRSELPFPSTQLPLFCTESSSNCAALGRSELRNFFHIYCEDS